MFENCEDFDKKLSLIFPFPFLSTEIITTGLMYNILVGKPEPALSRAKSKLRGKFYHASGAKYYSQYSQWVR